MYSTAIDRYTDAKKAAMNTYYMESMDDHIKRVKDKQRLDKRSRKKEAKAKKEKKAS
ncbi:hypothetical protein [Flavobacterium sp.]|uniref:hypothetical protein n=1 Tax=Flavobacterium sp. TaxID=239 RepID=UPI004033C2F1